MLLHSNTTFLSFVLNHFPIQSKIQCHIGQRKHRKVESTTLITLKGPNLLTLHSFGVSFFIFSLFLVQEGHSLDIKVQVMFPERSFFIGTSKL